MASLEELRAVRMEKMGLLKEYGMNPFTAVSRATHTCKDVLDDFEILEKDKEVITLGGRVMAIRGQGAISFVPLFDGTGIFQSVFKKDDMEKTEDGKKLLDLFANTVDIGDFIEVSGTVFITERGAQSLLVSSWSILTKTLRPLPDKRKGLQDADEKNRKRYLDILTNPELREMFEKKSLFWKSMRGFLEQKGFLEVETPTLEVTTGGAEASPFATHHNDFDLDVFLRISIGELWQKRLMAAGFPKTFEIGRAYRNEGSSPNHLQEFTNMEFYWGYADYKKGMGLVRDMYRHIAQEVFQTSKFKARGHEFDLNDEWVEIDYQEEILKQTGVDILNTTEPELTAKLDELEVKYEGSNRERMTDSLWKYCRKSISGPAFLIHHPVLMAPLAKRSEENPDVVERFQVLLGGAEVGNGYSELNDPLDQAKRFEEQAALLADGDDEAMMPDWDFVEMLEHGMPPTCGFGVGDRLFSFLVDKPIRETVFFPLMKPKTEGSKSKKKKESQVAVVVINKGAKMEPWQEINTVAHLNAAYGARIGKELFKIEDIKTQDEKTIAMNTTHAIMVKTAESNKQLKNLIESARERGLVVEEFTQEMLSTTNDKKIRDLTKEKSFDDVEHLGILVFGGRSEVGEVAEKFELYS